MNKAFRLGLKITVPAFNYSYNHACRGSVHKVNYIRNYDNIPMSLI